MHGTPRSGSSASCTARSAVSLSKCPASKGVCVTALHVGFMDTPMVADIDAPKADPSLVAAAALDGVERGAVEVLADERARSAKDALSRDRGASEPATPDKRNLG